MDKAAAPPNDQRRKYKGLRCSNSLNLFTETSGMLEGEVISSIELFKSKQGE
ncbi:hypothetical protein [Paenibacillus sp. RC67]|uniref:hypothetical protein n=1 Tax=Paenibacillus sp. RC67 TaxID=3039392 RepID=UPI0024AD360C|nr:hypothetical protein [Paenibacillus sp. RC67]